MDRAVLVIALTATSCGALPEPMSQHSATEPSHAYALQSDGHLLVARVDDGLILADLVLVPSPSRQVAPAHVMVLSADGATIYVLVKDLTGAAWISVVDIDQRAVVRTLLVGAGADYRSLALGPSSGRLFVFGNEDGAATVWIVEPSGSEPVRRLPARPAEGGPWSVYQGLVGADETLLFISYHGGTTGIDRFELRDGALFGCEPAATSGQGCINSHGGIHLSEDRLYAATGEGPLLALDPTTGATLAHYDLRLEGNHVVEFAVDESTQRIFVVGSCVYARGLSVVDVRSGATEILAPPRVDSSPCGERIAVTPDGRRLVVLQVSDGPEAREPGGKLVVLTDAGAELSRIATSAEAVDILVVPAP